MPLVRTILVIMSNPQPASGRIGGDIGTVGYFEFYFRASRIGHQFVLTSRLRL